MGLSQQIGASSLIKPGVIDNTAARPASPFEGQVIFQKDTDQLLVWNGTAWVIPNSPAQNPGGLELITSGTLSGSTTNITGCFSSSYDIYKTYFYELTTSGDLEIGFRMLSNTTPASTASTYSVQRLYSQGSTVGGSKSTLSYGRIGYGDSTAAFQSAYEITFFNPFAAKYTNIASGFTYSDSNASSLIDFNATQHTVATSYDGFQIYMDSGTVTGKYSVYGLRV